MKAKDYFEKYKDDMTAAQLLDSEKATPEERRSVVDRLLEAVKNCEYEMGKEVYDLMDQRNAMTNKAIASIIKEINNKWNAMTRLFVKEYGESPVKEDVIKNRFVEEIPGLLRYW